MNIVVIDDERTFHDLPNPEIFVYEDKDIALNMMRQQESVYLKTEAEACHFLWKFLFGADTIDELWLDHDLGHGGTVWPIVLGLAALVSYGVVIPINNIFVHTANPVRGKEMVEMLEWDFSVHRVDASMQGLSPF